MDEIIIDGWFCEMKIDSFKQKFTIKVVGKYKEPDLEEMQAFADTYEKEDNNNIIYISINDYNDIKKLNWYNNKEYDYIYGKIRYVKKHDNIENKELDNYKILRDSRNNIPLKGKKLIVINKHIFPSRMYDCINNKVIQYDINSFMKAGIYRNYIAISHTWSMSKNIECNCNFCFKDKRNIKYCFKKIIDIIKSINTRKKICYIWLDSLCVLQEQCYSQKLELTSMNNYYASAEKVIAVLTLDKTNISFRESMNMSLNFVIETNKERLNYIIDIFNNEWYTRGWTFQEAIVNDDTFILFKGDLLYLNYLTDEYDVLKNKYNKVIKRADYMWTAKNNIVNKIGLCLELYGDRKVQEPPDALLSLMGIVNLSDKLPDNYPYIYKELKEIMIKISFENKDNTLILLDKNNKNEYINSTRCLYCIDVINNLNIQYIGNSSCKINTTQWIKARLNNTYKFKELQDMMKWIIKNKECYNTLFEHEYSEAFKEVDSFNNNIEINTSSLFIINPKMCIDYKNGKIDKNTLKKTSIEKKNKFFTEQCSNKPFYIWECILNDNKIYLWGNSIINKSKDIIVTFDKEYVLSISLFNNNYYNGMSWCYNNINKFNLKIENNNKNFVIHNLIRI